MMNPVESHLWKDRVIIITASSPTNDHYKEQEQLLDKDKKGIVERDLKVYRLSQDRWLDPNNDFLSANQVNAIYKVYEIDPDTFSVILVGKDGGVKMRKNEIVSTKQIFQLVDTMPMRRQEMKRSKGPD